MNANGQRDRRIWNTEWASRVPVRDQARTPASTVRTYCNYDEPRQAGRSAGSTRHLRRTTSLRMRFSIYFNIRDSYPDSEDADPSRNAFYTIGMLGTPAQAHDAALPGRTCRSTAGGPAPAGLRTSRKESRWRLQIRDPGPAGRGEQGGLPGARADDRDRQDRAEDRAALSAPGQQRGSLVKVKKIRFSFPGSSQPAMDMQGVNMDGSLDLNPGEAAYWSNGRVDLDPDPDVAQFINNSVYLTGAVPAKVKVDVTCKNYSDPATITLPLAAHKSPVPEARIGFPTRRAAVATSTTRPPCTGPTAAPRVRRSSPDIGVVGWDSGANKWSSPFPAGTR